MFDSGRCLNGNSREPRSTLQPNSFLDVKLSQNVEHLIHNNDKDRQVTENTRCLDKSKMSKDQLFPVILIKEYITISSTSDIMAV